MQIGYWYLDEERDDEDPDFLEVRVTQDGYRCWYFSSWEDAVEFAEKYRDTIDTDVSGY